MMTALAMVISFINGLMAAHLAESVWISAFVPVGFTPFSWKVFWPAWLLIVVVRPMLVSPSLESPEPTQEVMASRAISSALTGVIATAYGWALVAILF